MVGALLCGLVLLLPLRGALGASMSGVATLWLFVALLVTVLLAWLLEKGGVRRPYGTCLTAAGAFAVVVLAALTLMALLGDPGNDTEVSLLAGLPAAAVATVVATVVQRRSTDDRVVMSISIGGFLIALIASETVGGMVHEARDDAEDVRRFSESGLTAFVPEIEDLSVRFGSTYVARPEGGGAQYLTGYSLSYYADSSELPWETAHVAVDVELADGDACEETSSEVTCDERDGYTVRERDGEVEVVVANRSNMRLEATFNEGDGDLPSPDEVGQALADAYILEWEDVFAVDE